MSAPASGQAPPEPGIPHNINVEILDGSAQDQVHAQYKPGSSLTLGATIRDAAGSTTLGTPTHPCTPEYELSDEIAPDGTVRAWIENNVIHFGAPPGPHGEPPREPQATGPFSVSVHCAEDPNIKSAGQSGVYQFETSRGTFAREAHAIVPPSAATTQAAPSPASPAAKVGAGSVLGGLLLAGLVVGGVYALQQKQSAADSCPSFGSCRPGDVVCMPDECACPSGFHFTGTNTQYCSTAGQHKVCTCNATVLGEQMMSTTSTDAGRNGGEIDGLKAAGAPTCSAMLRIETAPMRVDAGGWSLTGVRPVDQLRTSTVAMGDRRGAVGDPGLVAIGDERPAAKRRGERGAIDRGGPINHGLKSPSRAMTMRILATRSRYVASATPSGQSASREAQLADRASARTAQRVQAPVTGESGAQLRAAAINVAFTAFSYAAHAAKLATEERRFTFIPWLQPESVGLDFVARF